MRKRKLNYSYWIIESLKSLLSHMNGELTLNERWAKSKWTVPERWTELNERLVNDECERKFRRERKMSGERTKNANWTNSEFILRLYENTFFSTDLFIYGPLRKLALHIKWIPFNY